MLKMLKSARPVLLAGGLALVLGSSLAQAQPDAPGSSPASAQAEAASGQLGHADWSTLSPAQQQALAPLAEQWVTLDAGEKRRWLAIGERYARMQPAQQVRLQQRMREWSALTPEQRRIARDSYVRAHKLKPDQKSAEWEQYQLLTPEQKKQLAEEAAARRRIAKLPTPAAPAAPAASVSDRSAPSSTFND